MKKIFFAMVAMLATSMVSVAQSYNYGSNSRRSTTTSTYGSYGTNPSTTSVSGYTRSNGTYVNGYTRTQRNGTNHDNYSTSGNYNPYNGTTGSRARDYSTQSYNYGSGHTIQTGPRGGQYYKTVVAIRCMYRNVAILTDGKINTFVAIRKLYELS